MKKYTSRDAVSTGTVMKPRAEYDYYRTEPAVVRAYFSTHPVAAQGAVLDPCAGDGVWGQVFREILPDRGPLYGNEIQPKFEGASRFYDTWRTGDFLEWKPDTTFSLVMANPPFRQAEEFFHHARTMLDPQYADIIFLVRLGFLASERRYRTMFSREAGLTPTRITVLSTRPSFTEDGASYPGDFCIMRWGFASGQNLPLGVTDHLVYTREEVL